MVRSTPVNNYCSKRGLEKKCSLVEWLLGIWLWAPYRPLSSSQLLAVLELQGWQTNWVQHLEAPLPGRKSKNDNDICPKHREMQFEDLQNCQRKKGWWLSLLMGLIPKYQHTSFICFSLSEDSAHTAREGKKATHLFLETSRNSQQCCSLQIATHQIDIKFLEKTCSGLHLHHTQAGSKCIQNLSPMQ
jgi:hypothetical protein